MIIALINWAFVLVACLLTGLLVRKIFRVAFGCSMSSIDEVIMAGIMFCTVYAETFSLFYRVGVLCTLILVMICAAGAVICRKDLGIIISAWNGIKNKRLQISSGLALGILILIAATIDVRHPDTYLYHAQSVEWNELYGAVKGLGNLDNHFAYNSSFFCLQALFSWRGITGVSLHLMNGFLCFFAVLYAFCSMKYKGGRKMYASDLIRLIFPLYILMSIDGVSSPGSDLSAMIVLIYIMTKWAGHVEEKEEDLSDDSVADTVFLGILGVFSVSLKLSVIPLVLLCIYPLYRFLREKQWKKIILMIIAGTVVIAPFFIRNVIISGYLVYPFPQLDLFSFDWKMNPSDVEMDKVFNLVWGRAINYAEGASYDWPFHKWIVIWWKVQETEDKWIWVIDVLMLVINAVIMIRSIICKKINAKLFLLAVNSLLWLYWMLSAPLVRYGFVFLFLLPAGTLLYADNGERFGYAMVQGVYIIAIASQLMVSFNTYNYNLVWPEDYKKNPAEECTITSTNGTVYTLYYPKDDAKMLEYPAYDKFPHIPSEGDLKHIAMRGPDLSYGFRYVP